MALLKELKRRVLDDIFSYKQYINRWLDKKLIKIEI
jgi:hypothetical protein